MRGERRKAVLREKERAMNGERAPVCWKLRWEGDICLTITSTSNESLIIIPEGSRR